MLRGIDRELKLKAAIRRSLRSQGFHIIGNRVTFRQQRDKRSVRKCHQHAVAKRIELAEASLAPIEDELLSFVATGREVQPEGISPRLVQVEPDTIESRLFRYASLHWSIPVSDGYGRRLRFLIFDDHTGKIIGLFGLGDPVYAIRARDDWIGWDAETKAARLYHVMDAYVLGAVPPYSQLLGGKLVTLAAACNEVRRAFIKRYANRVSLIARTKHEPHLALITTVSALGRSSLYNRVKYEDRLIFQAIGFTGGWGEFHFSDGVYKDLSDYAKEHCTPTAKQERWGNGFRNRRELVRKTLAKLGFSQDMLNHGIQREVFAVPLARNAREFLRGEHKRPRYFNLPFRKAVAFWRERWLLPRAERVGAVRDFDPEEWRLWKKSR